MSKYLKINQVINQVEQLFPVNTWKVNDLDAWVLIRLQLGWDLLEHFNQSTQNNGKSSELTSTSASQEQHAPTNTNCTSTPLSQKIIRKIKRWIGIGIYYIKFYQEEFFYKYLAVKQIQRKANYLFFVPNSSVSQINNSWFNQFADPLIAMITPKEKVDYAVLEANNGIDNKTPKFYKNYYKFEKLIAYHLQQYTVQDKSVHLPYYEDFLFFLKKEYGLASAQLNIERMIQRLENIQQLSSFFQHLLKKNKTKYAFLVCYYWDWAMALIHACYQKGVKTIEIQHGSQENWFPYAQWFRTPLQGYNMLPDYFWCWTAGETKQINHWAKSIGRHIAFEGGHPWLYFFNTQKLIQNTYKNMSYKLEHSKKKGKKIILYTAQPLGNSFLDDKLINLIKETAENFIWWLRVHPRLLDRIDIFQQEAKKAEISHLVEITDASLLPLPLLLQYTDLHVTQESSSVIEAYLSGVPSIILSREGKVFYEFVQEHNYAFYYDNLQSDKIKEVIYNLPVSRKDYLHEINLKTTMQKVIQNKIEQLVSW